MIAQSWIRFNTSWKFSTEQAFPQPAARVNPIVEHRTNHEGGIASATVAPSATVESANPSSTRERHAQHAGEAACGLK
jgi:hypothetical protein